MKKITLLLMAVITAFMANAEPANPTPVTMTQSNGETIQIKLVGDEFYHFNTTIDGYTVIYSKGNWEYAIKNGDKLASSGVMAHDPAARSAQELRLVSSLDKYLVDIPSKSKGLKNRKERDAKNKPSKSPVVDYNTFRGLIILINYNDKQFQMSNANDFYNSLCNTQNYNGFYHQGNFQQCTGSVRDYYFDNSMGQFDPEFDIVGPVNLDYSCLEGNDKSREIFQAALDAVDGQVDFSQYDADNDGTIDMVFFMVAGYSSSYSGNNSGYLWPHMSYLYGYSPGTGWYYLQYDGKYMGRYASSCEIYGWESYGYTMPNAIGTICHEFGHVLGLPDLYDTDYEGGGGQSNDPGEWDVMAGGSSRNYGRTPVGYSLWERVELGFASEPEILTPGAKTLTAINISNTGYKMLSPNDAEYFLLENRQANKWDAALPGHGLVIARVDYSNPQVWDWNDVNSDPNHNYYELVRAYGTSDAGVPFPGSQNITEINSTTDPALLTWTQEPCQYGLGNITENNRIISFNVVDDVTPALLIEDFESMAASSNATNVMGNYGTWSFTRSSVVENNNDKVCTMISSGALTMTSDIDIKAFKVSATINNPSTLEAKFSLSYSTDEGEEWTIVDTKTVDANSEETVNWKLNLNQPARIKIAQLSGSKTKKVLIDDITFFYTDSTIYNLWVAGTQVNGANMGNLATIDGVEGFVQYLPISNSLTLSNATVSNETQVIINDIAGLHIKLLGNNHLITQRNVYGLYFIECDGVVIEGDGALSMESAVNQVSIGYFTHKTGEIAHTTIRDCSITTPGGIIQNEDNDCALTVDNAYIHIGDGYFTTPPELTLTNCHITKPVGGIIDEYGTICAGPGESMFWGEIEIMPGSAGIPGDVNGDGFVTSADVTAIYDVLLGTDNTFEATADVNGDGFVTSADVTAVYDILLGI